MVKLFAYNYNEIMGKRNGMFINIKNFVGEKKVTKIMIYLSKSILDNKLIA